MRIRILIVDDEPLARERIRSLLEKEPDLEIVGECGDGKSAVQAIRNKRPDLILLDIQMPEMDGFDVIECFDPAGVPAVIFVTAYDQFAVKAFEVHAADYLLKPVEGKRLHDALEHIRNDKLTKGSLSLDFINLMRELVSHRAASKRIAVKSEAGIVLLKPTEIDWVESAGSYVCFHAGPHTHISRETMQRTEQDLLEHNFIRIHRCKIVNQERIRKLKSLDYGEYAVELRDGTILEISRGYKDEVLRKIGYR